MKKIINKYSIFCSYVVIGIIGTIINITIYMLLVQLFSEQYLICNIIAYIISLILIFILNKIYVFKDKTRHYKYVLKQFMIFGLSRLLSLGIDTSILFICIEELYFGNLLSKIIANLSTTILNYLIGKKIIFK